VREAEESPLLEAVARQRLVNIQLAGKELSGAVVIL
jgi:DNA-binding TFAR19-related protein (PDSD5 family)